jgi:tetratricopeptide (TPR) repeat protein
VWLTAARVGLLAVAAFLPAIACGWMTTWDDDKNFLGNRQFRGLGWAQIAWAWKTTILGVYQPLCWMMYEAEYAAWGLNPKGFHIVGLALHGVVAAAVFALFVALLRRCLPELEASRPAVVRWSAAFAAAFWAVHPMRAEVAAWVSAQGYMPSTLCLILAVLAYLRAHDPGRSARGRLACSATALYAAAVLFKTVAVSLPIVLLVFDFYPLRRLGWRGGVHAWVGRATWRAWAEKLPFFAVGLASGFLAMKSRTTVEPGLGMRLAAAAYSVWFYPIKTLMPLWLSAMYILNDAVKLTQPLPLAAALGAVGLTAMAIWFHGRWPALTAAWVAYLLILAPNSGFVRTGLSVAADRYSYVSTLPLVALLAGSLCILGDRVAASGRARSFAARAGVAASLVLLGLCILSWFQAATWRTGVALWTHALEQSNGSEFPAEINLGESFSEMGWLKDAETHARRGVALRPDVAMGHMNLGVYLERQGRIEEAIPYLLEAVRLNPTKAEARTNLGMALFLHKDVPRAEEQLHEALRLRPDAPDAHYYLGTVLKSRGRLEEAEEHFAAARRVWGEDAGKPSPLLKPETFGPSLPSTGKS